jgi:putative PIN family toxin of toxin-antitoxin system
MKVVVDTNVIVSGLLNPYGAPAEILRLILSEKLIPSYDSRMISEYFEVLNRSKFKFNVANIKILIKEIEIIGSLVIPIPLKSSLPDPDDNIFLEAAIAGHAEYLITGNKSHFSQKLCLGINVLSPSEFIEVYKKGN